MCQANNVYNCVKKCELFWITKQLIKWSITVSNCLITSQQRAKQFIV